MPSPTYNHPTKPPDSPVDDSDSDLEIDLEELDPKTTSTTSGSSHDRRASGFLGYDRNSSEQPGPRIALRNLRMGGLRRGGKRRGGYGELGQGRDGSEDGDGYATRYSDGSGAGGDDAPLLSEHGGGSGGGRRRRSFTNDSIRSLTSSLRLPSFLAGDRADQQHDESDDEQDEDDPSSSRVVAVGALQSTRFPPNVISNAKYTPLSFLPVTLYNEFSFFFNMYFLLVALSQAIPQLRIGYLSTYIAPLAFVLVITLGKEVFGLHT